MVIGLDGKAYFNYYDQLYSLDLLTAKATLLGTLDAVESPAYGFSVDPTTGKLYLLAESGELFVIDPVAVTATLVGTWPVSEGAQYSYGISIDHAGTAWVVEYPGEESYSALWSTPLATFGVDPQRSGNILSAEGDDPTMWWVALTYAAAPAPAPAPEPVLAATGFDAAPLALGGLLLAAAGIVLVGRRSRRAA
jgi:LPXTG-motif cell wall-anchored protein